MINVSLPDVSMNVLCFTVVSIVQLYLNQETLLQVPIP